MRYKPYGEVRFSGLPNGTGTDYRFTGQRQMPGLGLYQMGARWVDPSLGRWLSADTLVPEPANPQGLNRYSFVLGNPLRYVDPSGYYSEEEIMQSFEVGTWDEVLAFFQEGGALEGLWGWLEILRKAVDGDIGMYGVYQGSGSAQPTISGSPANMGFFTRDDAGHIFVGGKAQPEFASQGRHFIYSLLRQDTRGVHTEIYRTPPSAVHFHGRWVQGSPDLMGAKTDLCMVGIDLIGDIAIANVELFPWSAVAGFGLLLGGLVVDMGEARASWDRIGDYELTGHITSYDILDSVGFIPEIGALTDSMNALSKLTGIHWEFTP